MTKLGNVKYGDHTSTDYYKLRKNIISEQQLKFVYV